MDEGRAAPQDVALDRTDSEGAVELAAGAKWRRVVYVLTSFDSRPSLAYCQLLCKQTLRVISAFGINSFGSRPMRN